MPNAMDENSWLVLLRRIQDGKCTPFLGAGACDGVLPLGGDVARQWSQQFGYPLEDNYDLARVAQFLAVKHDDAMFPKEEIIRLFSGIAPPVFTEADEPHAALASLPLPIYMTTNYDDFMARALQANPNPVKTPVREICHWNRMAADHPCIFQREPDYQPTVQRPLVFHLHGYDLSPESLVLTEDDYLDFLVNISRNQQMLPHQIQRAFTGTSLLFIGYRLEDWTFRVLFRGLVSATEASLRRISVTVQLPPRGADVAAQEAIKDYRSAYFDRIDVKVYWGTARQFAAELRERWSRFNHGLAVGRP